MVVADAAATANQWQKLLDAAVLEQRRSDLLDANITRLVAGSSIIELAEPDGTGIAADALSARDGRNHLFSGGFAVLDLAAFRAKLLAAEIPYEVDGDQLMLFPDATGVEGLRMTVNGIQPRVRTGLVDYLYEVTLLTDQVDDVCRQVKAFTGNSGDAFVPISSEKFGYRGQLTLFRSGHLHRVEVIHPDKPGTTMQRFHQRFGQSLYMAFCESPDILEIERRALEFDLGVTVDRPEYRKNDQMPDQLWLHPSALGGMMLGVSRPSRAWHWSGAPERVKAI